MRALTVVGIPLYLQHMVDRGVLVHASGDRSVSFDAGFHLFCIADVRKTPESSLTSAGVSVCACMRACVYMLVLLGCLVMSKVQSVHKQ